MTKKAVTFKPKPSTYDEKLIDEIADNWVSGKTITDPQKKKEEYFRFTIVLPKPLHKKIKKYCAINEVTMKEKIIDILEKEFENK